MWWERRWNPEGWMHVCNKGIERWFPYSNRCLFCGMQAPEEKDMDDG